MAPPPKGTASPGVDASHALLEREEEVGRLAELLDAAAEGRGHAAAVVGAAGIGKTSLLRAARELAEERGLACLSARGGELEQEFAYGVVRQLFELHFRGLPAETRAAALEGAAARAGPVIGLRALGEANDEDAGFAVVHGLYWLSVNLAERQPLVILVDDLHWADAASLRFLAYLARRVDELPVLLLTAARPAMGTMQNELVESLIDEPTVIRLAPAPLSVDATGAILDGSMGGTPEPAFVVACHEATAGNPFLCWVLAQALDEEGVRPVADQASQVTELATRAASTGVVRRLGRLSPDAIAFARAIAILGTQAELRHAAALGGLEPEAAAAAAGSLAAQGILRADATLDFVHPLVRAAIREQIAAAEQALLHARAARLLDLDGAPPERIAIHLLAAEPTGEPWVVETLRRAARTVQSKGDPAAAVGYLRRALREPPDDEARFGALRELGLAELHAGEPDSAAEHLAEAHSLAGSTLERARVAGDLSVAFRAPGRYEESAVLLERTIGEVEGLDSDLALALEAELFQSAMMQPATYTMAGSRLEPVERDVEGATRGERAILAALATERALRTARAESVHGAAVRAFDRGLLADQGAAFALWMNAAFPLIFADGLREAARVCTKAIEEARRRGSPVGAARAHTASAFLHLREGAIRDAESDARAGAELGRDAGFLGSLIALAVLVECLVERGELDAADDELRNAGLEGEIPVLFVANFALEARGRLRLAQSRTVEAIADLEELGRRGEHGWHPWNPAMLHYRSDLALALLRAGEPGRGRELAEDDLALARRWGTPRVVGVSLRTLGEVSGGERRIDLLRESVATLEGAPAPLELARAMVALGAAIAQSGKRTEAREPLHAGMELAHDCGATALTEHARRQLVAAGARPRRIMRTGIDALTPSELRVARMAAEGMTNREIAEALFVTLRTVQLHLTHTYQKLDISSRDDLPEGLAR